VAILCTPESSERSRTNGNSWPRMERLLNAITGRRNPPLPRTRRQFHPFQVPLRTFHNASNTHTHMHKSNPIQALELSSSYIDTMQSPPVDRFPPDRSPRAPPPAAPIAYCDYSEAMSGGMFSSTRCNEFRQIWFPTYTFFDNSGSNTFGYCLVDTASNRVISRQEAIDYDTVSHLQYICSVEPPPSPPAQPPSPPLAPICINLLDQMNLAETTCESILGLGKLTCLVGELHDQHLCDFSCGTCVCTPRALTLTYTHRTSVHSDPKCVTYHPYS